MAFVYRGKKVDLGFGRGWLDVAPAASIRRIDRAIGHPLQITEAGRTWAQQDVHYQRYLRVGWPIALSPNTPSEHQKGKSVDSDEAQRLVALMADHGWIRTVYRWVNGKWTLVEEWHFEYFPERDNHRNEGGDSSPTPPNPVTPRRRRNMSVGVIHTKDDPDNKRSGAIVDWEAGTFSPFGWFTVGYANGVAVGHGLAASGPVTRGHYNQIKRDIAAKAARDGKLFIDVADEDIPQIKE